MLQQASGRPRHGGQRAEPQPGRRAGGGLVAGLDRPAADRRAAARLGDLPERPGACGVAVDEALRDAATAGQRQDRRAGPRPGQPRGVRDRSRRSAFESDLVNALHGLPLANRQPARWRHGSRSPRFRLHAWRCGCMTPADGQSSTSPRSTPGSSRCTSAAPPCSPRRTSATCAPRSPSTSCGVG